MAAAAIALVLLWMFFLKETELFKRMFECAGQIRDNAKSFGQTMPLFLYPLIIFILPLFPIPISFMYFLAGGREESRLIVISACALGLIANVIVAYFVAGKFSNIIRPWLEKRGKKIPTIPKGDEFDLIFLVRVIPGSPLTVQNYLLGLAKVDFKKYLLVSLPIQLVQLVAYICFGDGIINGSAGKFFMGLSLLCVVAIIARLVQKRYNKKDVVSKAQ